MASTLGELVIELGFLADVKDAKKVADALDDIIEKASKAAKKLNEQKKSNEESGKTSNKTAKKIAKFVTELGAVVSAVGGAVVALNKLTDSLVQQNQSWINLTRNSDISLGTFQKWGQVGAALNSSLGEEGAAGAVAALNKRLFELRLTGEGARGFQLAGIMPTNAEDVLEQLRNRVRGMNDTSATYLLEQMGIDPRMLSVLRMTREEFEALNAEMAKYRLTPEQRQTIQEFHKQMSIVNVKMQYFKDRILIALLPHLERIMKIAVKLIEALPKYRGYIIAFGLIGSKIKPIAKVFKLMNKSITKWILKLPIVGRLFGRLGAVISRAFLPLAAAYLLLEDFAVFQEGGESVIGDIIEYFKAMGEDWLNIAEIFSTKPLEAFYAALVKVGDLFIRILQGILNIFDSIFGTPLGKILQMWLAQNNYEQNLKQLSEDLKYDAERVRKDNIAKNIVSNNVYNNAGNSNKTNNYSPTYKITIDSPEGQRILREMKNNDLTQAAVVFKG